MINFDDCSMMIFSESGEQCISYKKNQADFKICQRKYLHEFKARVQDQDFETAFGLPLHGIDHFMVADDGDLYCYDDNTYRFRYRVDL